MSGKARDYLKKLVPNIFKKKKKPPAESPPAAGNGDKAVELLTRLPPELQDMITGYLSQKDLLNCRQVSSGWKNMVDSLHSQDVVLQHSRGFRGTQNIPMKNCTICSLGNVNCRQFFQSNRTPKSVILMRDLNKWNFYELNLTWNNLTSLDIGWKTLAFNSLFGQIGTNFASKNFKFLPQLKSLAVGLPTFNGTGWTPGIIKKNGEFIFAQRFPNLQSLKLKFVFSPNTTELLKPILAFICAHSEILQDVHFESVALSYRPDSNRQMILMESNLPTSEYDYVFELPLNGMRFRNNFGRSTRRFGGNLDKNQETWISFLADQNSLEIKLSRIITDKILNYPLRTFDYFAQTIVDTAKYLIEINLSNLTPYSTPGTQNTPVNISILENCTFLEKLTLVRNGVIFEHLAAAVTPIEIVNLAQLPSSLKYLNIEGFAGESDDLNLMMTKLMNLEFLSFKQDGMAAFVNFVTGMDLRALEKIIKHPKLTDVNISLASYIRPRFCIRFYQRMMNQFKWTQIFYSIGFTFTRPKITMGRKL